MRRDGWAHEPDRDPQLRALLHELEGGAPEQEPDWAALHASITMRAELPLARRRRRAVLRPRLGLRTLVPLAAAGLVLALWLGSGRGDGPSAPPRTAAAPAAPLEEAFSAELSDQELRLLLSGRAEAEELLLLAVDDS